MTNNWADMSNSTLFIVMGANPAENHPASIGHINVARQPLVNGEKTITDRAGNTYKSAKPQAELIVVDPRKTRTALQADKYIRIRPGTDIAFINAVIHYIVDASGTGTGLWAAGNEQKKARFEAYHQATASNKKFFHTTGANAAVTSPKYTDASFNVTTSDYARSDETIGTETFVQMPTVNGGRTSPNIYGADTAFTRLKQHVAPYTPAVSADICGCTAAEIIYVADKIIANSRCSSVADDAHDFGQTINDPRTANYRSATFLYAMGLTQHTHGSQNVKSFAVLQTLMGNMGRSGGGINALRGIHNVQGSTDMGLLYHLIPGYSGNPSGTFDTYMNSLYGNRLTSTTAYDFTQGGLQQKGFWSMTKSFFGDTNYRLQFTAPYEEALSVLPEDKATMDTLFGLWPKGNGDNHIKMFRKMAAGTIKGAVVWGQNPAVTEPNQSKVREGLRNLDILVCVDVFENETAACDRKSVADGDATDGVTYLIPACSYVEEAGSATNSGRVLQWRNEARKPAGNSKSDIELLMRFAYALNANGAFAHIKAAYTSLGFAAWDPYTKLWAEQYGWTPGQVFNCESAASKCYKQMAAPQNNGGTMWLYLEGWDTNTAGRGGGWPAEPNRAKSRVKADADATAGGPDNTSGGRFLYKNWGYAWLVNRRVLYSNGDTPWDQNDGFQGPDLVARLFVSHNGAVIDYSSAYRTIHRMQDKPYLPNGNDPAGSTYAGRFPWHTEPYESPRPDLAAIYGYNSSRSDAVNGAVAAGNLVFGDTVRGTVDDFPLVLTSIRCVEHFQGGPITRNNWWNVEVEPEPWVEINSADARLYGIKDGDYVNVVTARSNSTTDQQGRTAGAAGFAKGFRARVGVGLKDEQRIAAGVVAIPWHWGDRGLSTGSRANDLCIDAMDANTTIPEYKACLCRIEKVNS